MNHFSTIHSKPHKPNSRSATDAPGRDRNLDASPLALRQATNIRFSCEKLVDLPSPRSPQLAGEESATATNRGRRSPRFFHPLAGHDQPRGRHLLSRYHAPYVFPQTMRPLTPPSSPSLRCTARTNRVPHRSPIRTSIRPSSGAALALRPRPVRPLLLQ